ncbi:copper homeostasis periplasmic binding protein CopC [Massilia arenosa]|uniref:Copper homeostasis periplasmic binding protein CopC n=2 Tax=Zemynaea arenosa TaxID=2561931 RepID=A0A4Y9RWG2_9BURK|nr:copper homeostasis periplasmic binding protein CopC [Massilia arenosa]
MALLLTLASATGGAWAHAALQSASPAASAVLAKAPKEIRLSFNEAVEGPFSKIALSDAQHAAVALPAVQLDAKNPKVMTVAVPPLKPGTYQVQWSTMTRDGHKTKGQYSFQVK